MRHLDTPELAALLLFAVEPSDRALTGWGGSGAWLGLAESYGMAEKALDLQTAARRKEVPRWRRRR